MNNPIPPIPEEIKTTASELLGTLRKLIADTSVRRIVVRSGSGRTVLDVPLSLGVVGLIAVPFWVGAALLVGTAGGYSIQVEREGEPAAPVPPTGAQPTA